MPNYLVSVLKWENPKVCASALELSKGDVVVIRDEMYNEIGIATGAVSENPATGEILRIANEKDLAALEKNNQKRREIFSTTKGEIRRLGLLMKLIETKLSLDGGLVTVIFTADERVDFRELVKSLSRIFRRSVRMYQIGSRDEARRIGGCGVCGKELCCLRFPGDLPSISIEMARLQQLAHRGSDRISGICGRLMCCLAYETEQYREMLKGMPEVHAQVKTSQGKGTVLELNVLAGEIKLRLEDGKIISVKKEELK
jgi:cell fate regulator YaaT (PSP1 superfamily)